LLRLKRFMLTPPAPEKHNAASACRFRLGVGRATLGPGSKESRSRDVWHPSGSGRGRRNGEVRALWMPATGMSCPATDRPQPPLAHPAAGARRVALWARRTTLYRKLRFDRTETGPQAPRLPGVPRTGP
jgi:hypothetical protein